MDVYYLHKFSVNGVYLGDRMAFVQETARLRPVPGRIDEPLPQGHRARARPRPRPAAPPGPDQPPGLGQQRHDLNPEEVARARSRAEATPGSIAVPEIRKKADEAQARGDQAEARKLLGWLAELPGEGADEARRKLQAPPAEVEKKDAVPAAP